MNRSELLRKKRWKKRGKVALGWLATLTAVAAIITVILYADAHTDSFTFSEQAAEADRYCTPRGGVSSFDDVDDSGSGQGPANVICRDGSISALSDPHPDPDVPEENPFR